MGKAVEMALRTQALQPAALDVHLFAEAIASHRKCLCMVTVPQLLCFMSLAHSKRRLKNEDRQVFRHFSGSSQCRDRNCGLFLIKTSELTQQKCARKSLFLIKEVA